MKNYILLLGLFFYSLNFAQKNNNIHNDLISSRLYNELFTPIQLEEEKTIIDLNDYFVENIETATIIRLPKGLTISENKSGILTINGKMEQTIDYISIKYNDYNYDIPVRNTARIPYTFNFNPDRIYENLQIKGSFNAWDINANPLVLNAGKYSFTVMLNPGNYQYCFVEQGKEFIDPTNPHKISNGIGGYNSTFSVGNLDQEKAFITSYYHNHKWFIKANQKVHFLVFFDNQFQYTTQATEISSSVIQKFKLSQKKYIRIYAYNENGVANDILIPLQNEKPILNAQNIGRNDPHNMILYSLMTDRFYDGNPTNNYQIGMPEVKPEADWQGGDFKGITKKIQEGFFKNLGVNTLWISPILQNTETANGLLNKDYVQTKFSGYHGYWPESESKLDPRFGTESEFKELLDIAHQNELNILVDYVANHIYTGSELYKNHPDWFTNLTLPDGRKNIGKFDEHRFTTWFDTHIAKFDYSNPDVINAISDSALVLYKKYAIDGFRHDAVKHIQNDFWKTLTRKIRIENYQTGRNIYQIGETYGSHEMINSYVNNGMLNGQFEFSLYHHLSNTFTNENSAVKDLKVALEESMYYYGSHHVMGLISGNHDKIRITSKADGSFTENTDTHAIGWTQKIINKNKTGFDKTALVMAFNLTTPGVPVIYYGDEYGMPGADDPDNRRMMEFDFEKGNDSRNWVIEERKKLVAKTIDLIKLRKNNMSLIYGDTKILYADNRSIVYLRNYMNNTIVVAINAGNITKKIALKIPSNTSLKTLETDKQGVTTINLQPNEYRIIK